jgi:hypothetical protein
MPEVGESPEQAVQPIDRCTGLSLGGDRVRCRLGLLQHRLQIPVLRDQQIIRGVRQPLPEVRKDQIGFREVVRMQDGYEAPTMPAV